MSYNLINFKKIKLYIYNLIKEIIKDIIYFQILQEQNIPIALKIFTLNNKKNLKWYKIYNVFDNNIPIDPISLDNIKIKEMQFLNNRIYNKETIISILKISNKDPYTRNEINFECIYNSFFGNNLEKIINVQNFKSDIIKDTIGSIYQYFGISFDRFGNGILIYKLIPNKNQITGKKMYQGFNNIEIIYKQIPILPCLIFDDTSIKEI